MKMFISFAKPIHTNKETHVMTHEPTACRKQSMLAPCSSAVLFSERISAKRTGSISQISAKQTGIIL
jgi:hypothetical protein